jgi:hypothetical protein
MLLVADVEKLSGLNKVCVLNKSEKNEVACKLGWQKPSGTLHK